MLLPGSGLAQDSTNRQQHIVERGEHHRIWESYTPVAAVSGEKIYQTNRVVELASGLHYWDGAAWIDSKEEIEIIGGKAIARHGSHKVTFAGNLTAIGAVEVNAQDGKKFRSQVMGLSYYDTKTGESVLIAEVKSSEGFVLPPNQVIYVDAFTDVKADVRYTYTKAGLEQDIILREAPPSPAEFGLDPATTRLEVMTEFLQPPAVRKQLRVVQTEENSRTRRGMVSPDFVDEALDFGAMKMGGGKAFQLDSNGQSAGSTVPVAKQWQQLEGRDFLIEAVQYPTIRAHLESLPRSEAKVKNRQDLQKNKAIASESKTGQPAKRVIPRKLVADATSDVSKSIQIAKLKQVEKGVVLDYLLLSSSATNMTFAGDTTYLISGEVVLEGTTTFEGGAVIKYTNNVANSRLRLKGAVIWDTATYRPAIFTALDDNTVGDNLPGSTGSPTNYYASTALLFDNGLQNDIKHIRVSHAATAIDGASVSVSHGQFVNSGNGLSLSGNNFSLHNVLFSGVLTNIYSSLAVTGALEHVTFDRANYLAASATNSLLLITNSLIYSVTNYGPFSWSTNQVVVVGGSSPFTNVGSGWHYLPTNSAYLDVGTTNISASLRKDFAEMTTAAPLIFTNLVSSNMVLNPYAARDTNQPDLGYHYYALDYAAGNCWVTNATLTLTNGVAFAGFGSPGFWLMGGSRLVSEGSPLRMNRFIRYAGVQEIPQAWGTPPTSFEMFNTYVDTNTPPTVKFRFCEFIATKADVLFYTGVQTTFGWHVSAFDMRDCVTHGGTFRVDKGGLTATDFKVINNIFDRTYLTCYYGFTNTFFLNNYHRGGTIQQRWSTNSPVIQNSILAGTTIIMQQSSGPAASYNAYLGQTNRFTPTSTNDVLTNMTFVAGPLGSYYQTNNSPLANTGSQLASVAGLYHYTTTTNQAKETNSIVDIGFHYVALDTQGNPVDTDGDGIPDYLEDKNGNGVVDSGETDWLNPDSDYDGVSDGAEIAAGTDPLSGASVPLIRLAYWRFNSTNWLGEAGQIPLVATNLLNPTNWSGMALSIDSYSTNLHLLNVDISGSTPTTMSGGAAYGKATNDYWNTYYGSSISLKTVTNLLWADQSNSTVSITVSNAPGSWGMSAATGNRMYDDYNYPQNYLGKTGITFSNLSAGYYDLYIYCHGAANDQNSAVGVYSGTNYIGGGFTAVTSDYASTNWIEGKQYVRARDVYASSNTFAYALISPDASSYAPVNGIQVVEKKIAQLKYRDVEASGAANINLANGSIRFWFRPNWSGTNAGGNGHGSEGRLIELGQKTTTMSNGWWGVSVNKEGTRLTFAAQGGGVETNYLVASINWTSNIWHQAVLTYTATNSIFYIDGTSVTNGVGSTIYPGSVVRANGFSIGSDCLGLKQAEGQFDELETFNYPLNATDIYNNYQDVLNGDWDGNGVLNYRDANPNDPYIGGMAITIERPKSGVTYP